MGDCGSWGTRADLGDRPTMLVESPVFVSAGEGLTP